MEVQNMKNTTQNIKNVKIHYFFSKEVPELVDEFKQFVVSVNKYLIGLQNDPRYHKSATRGKSKSKNITFEDEDWKFCGKLTRKDQPYTEEAVFYYRGRKVWRMERHPMLLETAYQREEAVIHCMLTAAENYDTEMPWRGPECLIDEEVQLQYESVYSGADDDFTIEEIIRDVYGVTLWTAVCKGGYLT